MTGIHSVHCSLANDTCSVSDKCFFHLYNAAKYYHGQEELAF